MTNLLGPNQTIITNDVSIELDETMFVGEQGYSRNIISKPTIGKTSFGSLNYKQEGSSYPVHEFKWIIVVPKALGLQIILKIEYQQLQLKLNNSRNFAPYVLRDNKLATPLNSSPDVIAPIDSMWGWAEWNIVFNKISYEQFGVEKLKLNMSATQVF